MIIAWVVCPDGPRHEPDSRGNQKRKEPRKFKEGDRVRVVADKSYDDFLQEDNRVGTVVVCRSLHYWLFMDRPVIKEGSKWDRGHRPSAIPKGHAYLATHDQLECIKPIEKKKLMKPDEARKRLKILVQTALELTQIIETTFKKTQKYPIFGMNLATQEPVEKNQSSRLNDCLSSLGVVLHHLYTGESEHNNHGFLLDGYSKPEDMSEGCWEVINKLLKGEYGNLVEFKKDIRR